MRLRADHLDAPHASRLARSDRYAADILERHRSAVEQGDPTYVDPATTRSVFTAAFLVSRGSCCDSGCRHCPWVGAEDE